MQIVIDIPEKTVNEIRDNAMFAWSISSDIRWDVTGAIVNGTPLPKGHGRIGDLDAVMSDIKNSIDKMTDMGIIVDGQWLWEKLNDAIYNAKPIVEADKGESEDS